MESLSPSLHQVEHEPQGFMEKGVKQLQQQFFERRKVVAKAREEHKASGYDEHYADVPNEVIPLIDTRDLRMFEGITHITSGQQLQQVKSEFDEYFSELEERKKMIAVILLRELRAQQSKFINQRPKV